MPDQRTLSATQATRELGVRPSTLYAYVSRGLIRSEAAGADQRGRRYLAEDIEQLKARKKARRNPARAVQEALHWGAPVLDSRLTLISDGRLLYRGHDAIALASKATIEQVAGLLWLGDLRAGDALFAGQRSVPLDARRMHKQQIELSAIQKMQTVLPIAGAADFAAYDLRPESVAQTGARIFHLLVSLATAASPLKGSAGAVLQQHWMPHHLPAASLINAAMILCADHELNVSAFTVRCVASAGATPHQAVVAGLAALQGMRHGGSTERVDSLWRELDSRAAGNTKGISSVLTGYLKRGEAIPGMGHVLYPEGDPRAVELMRLAGDAFPKAPAIRQYNMLAKEAGRLIGETPNIDLALVALARLLNLPDGGALTLFALGRTIGWIGHAIEQYQSGQIIRPRARYVGEIPAA
jgi:citrate synthase